MDTIALILSIVGCVNWGLVGIFQFDLVAWLFGGSGSLFSRLIYTVIALAGLWCISFLFRGEGLPGKGIRNNAAAQPEQPHCHMFFSLSYSAQCRKLPDRRTWR